MILMIMGRGTKMIHNETENQGCLCKIGEHGCSVMTQYGWCCDVCLAPELLYLNKMGVCTFNSCCGHGNNSPCILAMGDESIAMMKKMGYGLSLDDQPYTGEYHGLPLMSFIPKTVMPYQQRKPRKVNEA